MSGMHSSILNFCLESFSLIIFLILNDTTKDNNTKKSYNLEKMLPVLIQAHQYHSKRYRRDSSEGKFGDILPNPYHFQNGSPPHDPRAAPLVGLGNIISQPSYARGGSNRASGSFDGFGGFQTPIPHTTRVPQHYSGGKGERVGGGRGGGGFGQFDHPYLSRTSTGW